MTISSLRLDKVLFVGLVACLLLGFTTSQAHAQLSIPVNENFDGIGTTATATLPTNWRVDKQTTSRQLGNWSAAVAATERSAGNNMATTAANGIYNYGAGDAGTATDRAIGWLSSSSATKSGNLYAFIQNTTANSLTSVNISYQVEKYRNGSNPAGFSIQMYVSTDGSTWNSAGSNFLTTFSADADNSGFASAPGTTTTVSNQALALGISPLGVSNQILRLPSSVAPGNTFYLAWNYSVASGTTTSNAQALGVDDFVLAAPLAVNLSSFNAAQQGNAVEVTWETATEQNNRGFNLYRSTTADAPAQQLNSTLIPSQAQGSMSGFAYTWTDSDGLVNGQSFYYWVEAVDVNGAATLYGPVSVTYVAPTAVTLSQLRANGGSGSVALWVLPAALLAVGGLAVWRRRAAPLR